MTRDLYTKVGDGFIAGKHYTDKETISLTRSEARHPLLEGIIKGSRASDSRVPASKAVKKAVKDPSKDTEAAAASKPAGKSKATRGGASSRTDGSSADGTTR